MPFVKRTGLSILLVAEQFAAVNIVRHLRVGFLFNDNNDERRTMKLNLKKMAFVLSLSLGLGVSMSVSAAANSTMCDTYARKCALGIDIACQWWEIHCNTDI